METIAIILVIALIINLLSEVLSLVVFSLLKLGFSSRFLLFRNAGSPSETYARKVKNFINYAFFMTLIRFAVPIAVIYNIFANFTRNIYIFTLIFFVGMEFLTYKNLNFKLSVPPRSASELNIPYLIIIFICIVGYFA